MQVAKQIIDINQQQIIPLLRVRVDKNTVLTLKNVKDLHHYRKKYPQMKVLAR